MTATPAWPPQSTVRLFVGGPLSLGATVRIDGPQAHYLGAVMRLKIGEPVILCDNVTGEWVAIANSVGKREILLTIGQQTREREPVPDLWMLIAPIKKARIDLIIEKACELGIARIVPVITQRTNVERINLERLRTIAVEAAEQCARTALPEIADPVKLPALLGNWSPARMMYFADETGGVRFAPSHGPAAILIGPEGGFTPDERDAILSTNGARGISLGPRILRAETAAITAIAVWMAAAGDWQ